MKMTSGVQHPLVGEAGRTLSAARPAAQLPGARACPGLPQPATRRSVRAGAAQAQPAAPARRRAPVRSHTLALLGLASSAALLGCASLPASTWRVEPVFRVEGASPNAARGYLALAQKYEAEGRVEQALDAYQKAAQSAADSAEAQNTLGLALARHGRIESAITALRRAVALAPDRAPLLNNLAYALLLDGRADEARAMFRLTLAVDPAHQIASRNLAHLNQQLPAMAASPPAPVAAVAAPAVLAATAPGPAAPVVSTVVAAVELPSRAAPIAASIGAPSAVLVETPVSTARTTPTQPLRDGFSVEIMNGNGVAGAAVRMRDLLQDQGIYARRVANLPPYKSASTQVLYRPGKAEEARVLVQRLPVNADIVAAPAGSTLADLRLVIGHDARHSAGCTALAVCAVADRGAAGADQKLGRL